MSDLIVFFSRKGENYVFGTMKVLEIGNTHQVADIIKRFIEVDVFEIKMKEPYSKNYNDCINEAQEDQRKRARPILADYPKNIDAYETIYLGFPIYWGTMPMAVFTFLEQFDFTGKTIIPFCTHEGSGFGNSLKDIQKSCPTATLRKGIAVLGSRSHMSKEEVKTWIDELGLS